MYSLFSVWSLFFIPVNIYMYFWKLKSNENKTVGLFRIGSEKDTHTVTISDFTLYRHLSRILRIGSAHIEDQRAGPECVQPLQGD